MAREPAARFPLQHELLFKTTDAAASPGFDLFPITGYYGNSAAPATGTIVFSPGVSQQSSLISSPCRLLEAVPGLRHDTGLAIEWSTDEQYKLEGGLAKYANEPSVMRYIKTAALLPDKTVRDVALRCKWMERKKRKQDAQISGKKAADGKEILVESSSKNSFYSAPSANGFSLTTNNHNWSDSMLYGAIDGASRRILEENNQAFSQISANLSSLKLHQNIDLFLRTKFNLSKLLNDIADSPGIMNRMPPLPVVLNEELASSIFPPL